MKKKNRGRKHRLRQNNITKENNDIPLYSPSL